VASAASEPELLVTDLDLAQVAKARETIAVLRNSTALAHGDRAESRR
jgi:deaminated glutathione amidase